MITTCDTSDNLKNAACKLCMYWKPDKEMVAYPPLGECRRKAPDSNKFGAAQWPCTAESCWCGEFKHKL